MTRSWTCFSITLLIEATPLTGCSGNISSMGKPHSCQDKSNTLPGLFFNYFFQSFLMFVCRVSRRPDAKVLIQELNVGDAAEPQGRGTGQTS